MKLQCIPVTLISLSLSFSVNGEAKAATFTFDPTITFEVIDGGFSSPFDGRGDELFPGNFDTVVLGTLGESAEFAEFDISGFSVPSGEVITSATFQAQIYSTQVFGLGSPGGIPPNSLGAYGYVGNGIPEASDFQAGTLLDTVDTSSADAGQILTFEVTSFVKNLVSNSDSFVGLGVRAQDIGGVTLAGRNFFGIPPTLTIATAAVPATVPEPSSALGLLAFGAFAAASMHKFRQKQQIKSVL